MGLLTNPNSEDNNKLVRLLKTHNAKIGILSYIVGIVWLLFLANANYNLKTYFSENALLPGLVVEHFDELNRIEYYLSELTAKENSDGGLRPSHIISMFQDIGLVETELQNFTLIHPVLSHSQDKNGITAGVNAFGVLRAKRAAGTESLIFNTPYFPKNGVGRRNIVGIATMLALAEYFQQQVYWAKDILFLVAEGHVGSLAWVKGHQEIRDSNENLLVENVHTKVGNIQAAINFILEGSKICSMETKFHGVNGQLPNLDLVNLLNKFVFNIRGFERDSTWEDDIWKLYSYMLTQGTGTPTGSHGYFLKYGIESVTLFGKSGNCRRPTHYSEVGRILEATFRSLNNLLERFHQSFFFYLKTSPKRFISIGLYCPPLALILLAIPLKASAIWLTETKIEIVLGLFYTSVIHFVSVFFRWILSNLHTVLPNDFDMTPTTFTSMVLAMALLEFIITQFLLRFQSKEVMNSIYCFVLLELSISLYTFGLFNPSLVFILGILIVPFVTFFFIFQPSLRSFPYFGVLAILTAIVGFVIGNYLDTFIISGVNKYFYESEVYGNFLFNFLFIILLPIFSCIIAVI